MSKIRNLFKKAINYIFFIFRLLIFFDLHLLLIFVICYYISLSFRYPRLIRKLDIYLIVIRFYVAQYITFSIEFPTGKNSLDEVLRPTLSFLHQYYPMQTDNLCTTNVWRRDMKLHSHLRFNVTLRWGDNSFSARYRCSLKKSNKTLIIILKSLAYFLKIRQICNGLINSKKERIHGFQSLNSFHSWPQFMYYISYSIKFKLRTVNYYFNLIIYLVC